MERPQSGSSWQAEKTGRVIKLSDPVPDNWGSIKTVASGKRINGQCAGTAVNWSKHAEYPETAGSGEHMDSAAFYLVELPFYFLCWKYHQHMKFSLLFKILVTIIHRRHIVKKNEGKKKYGVRNKFFYVYDIDIFIIVNLTLHFIFPGVDVMALGKNKTKPCFSPIVPDFPQAFLTLLGILPISTFGRLLRFFFAHLPVFLSDSGITYRTGKQESRSSHWSK